MKLVIECSTPVALVALVKDGNTIIHQKENQNLHSKYMLSMIDSLLKEASVTPKELTAIVVGEGPGSYTGARIAVTIAKMFALQLNIPLFAFDSLGVFATSESICAVEIQLKRRTVLGGVYDMSQGQIIHSPKYYDQDEWDKVTAGLTVIAPQKKAINLDQLILREIKDINSFSPNYAREWQPT